MVARRSLGIMLVALMATLGASAVAVPKRHALGAPPYEGDCLGFTEARGCFYKVRETTFDLDRHIYRVGDTVVGTGRSGFGESTLETGGPGLKLLGCHGKPNPGPASCRWKAKALTNGWRWNTMGILVSLASSRPYLDSTFYAVVGDEPSIEGMVTRPDGKGVAGAVVQMAGPKTYKATTDEKGYYYAFVKAGKYRVTPAKPVTRASPKQHTVRAKRDASVEAHFKLCPPDGEACPNVTVVKSAIPDRDPRYAGAPVSLRYKGTGWDPEGGPIDVRWSGEPAPTAIYPAFEEPPYGSWDGQSERTFPAADTFTADVFGTQWPDRSTINQRPPYSCSGLLTVTQDDEVVDITRLIRPVGHVVYAYRSPLHTDDVFCPNEISAGLDGRADSQIPGFLVVYSHPAIAAFDDKKFITGGVIAAKDASGKSKRRVMCLEGYAEKKRLQVFFDNTRGDGRVHLDAKLDNGACS